LPHQGYFFRTHPHTALQGAKVAEFAIKRNSKNLYIMMPQQPYTEPTIKAIKAVCEPAGVKVSSLIYDIRKTSFRSEVDQMAEAKPDIIFIGGYAPDITVLTRDMYRANVSIR